MTVSWRSALETAIIVGGIASLWPYTLGYRAGWYLALLAGMIVALLALAVVRWRRFRRALSEVDSRGPKP